MSEVLFYFQQEGGFKFIFGDHGEILQFSVIEGSPEGQEGEVDVGVGGKASFKDLTFTKFGDEDVLLITDLDEDTTVITDATDASGSLIGVNITDLATGETTTVALVNENGELIPASELQTTQTEDGLAVHVDPLGLSFSEVLASIDPSGSDGKIDSDARLIFADNEITKVELTDDKSDAQFVFANRIGATDNFEVEGLDAKDTVVLAYDGTTSTTQIEECLIYDLNGGSLSARATPTGGSPTTANPEPNFNSNSASEPGIIVVLGTLGDNLDVIDLGNGAYKLTDGADWEEIVNVEDKNGVGVEGLENMFQFVTPEEQAADLV